MTNRHADTVTQNEIEEVLVLRVTHMCGSSTRRFLGIGKEALYMHLQHKGHLDITDQEGNRCNRPHHYAILRLTPEGIRKLERLGCRTFGRERGRQNGWDLDLADWVRDYFNAEV